MFAQHFSTEDSIYRGRTGPVLIQPSLVKIGSLVSVADSGGIAAQARQVEEHMLEYMQACLAKFGLTCWCPDFCQTSYALYNAAC